jgi:hypothetical protein
VIDDLGRPPAASTDKRYTFETAAGVRVAVWAFAYWHARELLVDAGHADLIWVGTSPDANALIEAARL